VSDDLQTTIDADSARLVLNRPENGNRVTTAVLAGIGRFLDEVAEAGPPLLVIEGRGEHFCAGRDASGDTDPTAAEASLRLVVEIGRKIRELPSLVLSSVQGQARGFGAGVVLHSDFAVAARDATLAFDEVERGFPPTIVMSYIESHLPRKLARELVCTGRVLSSSEAERLGIVNRVVEGGELPRETERLAGALLAQPRPALERCKPFLTVTAAESQAQREERAVSELVVFLGETRGEGEH
jgi:enoyl-CoA hydratase/carnithine racemase